MDAELFLRDLEAKPGRLRSLADGLDAAPVWGAVPPGTRRVVLIGMGSSRYAAAVIAARLRASGVHAVAEYASAEAATPGGAGTVAIGISATGKTEETTAALRRHRDAGSAAIALTNAPASAIAVTGTGVLDLMAGPEEGGVACRT
ncbi:MAG: SIS domain-containing protein, partial [Actinobacteria bacterium]